MNGERHRSARKDADHRSAVVKALELAFRAGDLPVGVAADQCCVADPVRYRSDFRGEMLAATKPRRDAVEEQRGLRLAVADCGDRGLGGPLGGLGSRLVRTFHDPDDTSDRDFGRAVDRPAFFDRKRHAQAIAIAGVDPEDVLQEERDWRRAVEFLALGGCMLLERLHCGKAVEADERQPVSLGHPERFRCGFPAMADTDAQRLPRQDLQGDRCIGEHLGAVEDSCPLKTRIVPGAPAEELIVTSGGNRQLVRERVGIAGQCIGQNKCGAVREGMFRIAFETLDNAFGGSGSIRLEVLADSDAVSRFRIPDRECGDETDAKGIVGELAS